MMPNGYWRDTGYWTGEKTWAPGRPVDEVGCDACAKVVLEAGAAHIQAKQARESSAKELEAVIRAAATDLTASLDGLIERYADAEVARAERMERGAWLDALVAAQDRRASSKRGVGDAEPAAASRPQSIVESDVRRRARARARRKAEEERRHQRLVNENRSSYGDSDELAAEHEELRCCCQRVLPPQHPLVLLACVVAGVAGAIELERLKDWLPPVVDALRYSEDVRVSASVLVGAAAGVLLFRALCAARVLLHRRRVRRSSRRAVALRDRIGCGSETCTRCPRPGSFPVMARITPSRVGGYLMLGTIAFAVYAGIAVGDPLVKLQRVGAVVPERIRDDCRQRSREGGPVELVCRGRSLRAIGLRRAYFQFGNPSYDTYGEGIFTEAAAFRRCGSGRTRPGALGKFAYCGLRAAIWTDERVVAGGAIGRRAWQFARRQHSGRD